MKNTRFNVQRGMINDSDSYASEIGTAYGPPSVKQSYENLDPKRFQSERGAKKAEYDISADVKSGIKSLPQWCSYDYLNLIPGNVGVGIYTNL